MRLLNEQLEENQQIIRLLNANVAAKGDAYDKCASDLSETASERNRLAKDLKEEKGKVQKKNKTISRLFIVIGVESIILLTIIAT